MASARVKAPAVRGFFMRSAMKRKWDRGRHNGSYRRRHKRCLKMQSGAQKQLARSRSISTCYAPPIMDLGISAFSSRLRLLRGPRFHHWRQRHLVSHRDFARYLD